jgi:AAA+ superfamily predicted ATPase
MQNLDIQSIAKLADATLVLVENAPNDSQSEFETKVEAWTQSTTQTIEAIGTTNKMKLLMQQFNLDKYSAALLGYALLPTLDTRYLNYFEALTANEKTTVPTIDLLETLVTTSYTEKNQVNSKLEDDSPIFFWRMLTMGSAPNFLTTPVQPCKDLVVHFAEEGTLDQDPTGLIRHITHPELLLPFDTIEKVPDEEIVVVNGGFPARQRSWAYQLGQLFEQPVYTINNIVLAESEDPVSELKEGLLFIALNNGFLYWQDGSSVLNANPEYVPILKAWAKLATTRVIIGENEFEALPVALNNEQVGSVDLKKQTRIDDKLIWQAVGETHLGVTNINYELLNNIYYMDYQRIRETILRVKQLQEPNEVINTNKATESYIATSPENIVNIANLDRNDFTFNDMILPDSVTKDITSVQKAYLNRVLLDPSEPTGVITIFEGAVGTGKTMAAECLGNQLQLPVYKIDYAMLADRPGNIETSLNLMFDEAERNSACLLFDEADGLFSPKSNDPDSVYNLVTAYLIQRIETYNGLVILTTNCKPKIDKAFFRRAMIVVTFPPFKPQQRYDLFVKVLADMGVEVSSEVNLKHLAVQLNANGKQIQNIINNAVLSASEANLPLDEIVIAAKDMARAINIERNK